ncbi:hypothetical protein SMMN14_07522 [Sphaerulina musiva]
MEVQECGGYDVTNRTVRPAYLLGGGRGGGRGEISPSQTATDHIQSFAVPASKVGQHPTQLQAAMGEQASRAESRVDSTSLRPAERTENKKDTALATCITSFARDGKHANLDSGLL